jgi:hypothetical protein
MSGRRRTAHPQRDAATGYVYVDMDTADARPRPEHVSEHSRFLSPRELTHARLRLAQEMVSLVRRDTPADPSTFSTTLDGLAVVLDAVVRATRGLG